MLKALLAVSLLFLSEHAFSSQYEVASKTERKAYAKAMVAAFKNQKADLVCTHSKIGKIFSKLRANDVVVSESALTFIYNEFSDSRLVARVATNASHTQILSIHVEDQRLRTIYTEESGQPELRDVFIPKRFGSCKLSAHI